MVGITQKNSEAAFPLWSLQRQWLGTKKRKKKNNIMRISIAYWGVQL